MRKWIYWVVNLKEGRNLMNITKKGIRYKAEIYI
jgi:hypothetical protein